ncbi:MAG: helix-turn-helix domain-containing protein [Streptosporangiaceae bacterium]|nr:helix-turn-helix domain-containing protein [Streptosporangiaceae bacterium]
MPTSPESEAITAARKALGRQLAAQRQAAGYSQQAFAPLTGYGRSTLANVETGRQNVPRPFWVRCQEELGIDSLAPAYDEIQAIVTAERLAAAGHAQAMREARVTAWRQAHHARQQLVSGITEIDGPIIHVRTGDLDAPPHGAPEQDEEVRRHDFLSLAGGAVAGLVAAPLLHAWADSRSPVSQPLTDIHLSQLQALTEGFRWLDRRQGASELLSATMRHAHAVVQQWRQSDAGPALHTALARVAADACHLVAYQLFDQGDRHRALEWYRCAAELAARGHARELYVFALCGVAWMHAQLGDDELALAILEQLDDSSLPDAAQCYIAIYRAQSHAEGGRRDAALHELDVADIHASASINEAPSPRLGIPDSQFVTRQRAMIMARFGLRDSMPILATLDEHTSPAFQRYRVTLTVTRAQIHATTRQTAEAAALLKQALEGNATVRSVEKMRQILATRRALEQDRDSPEVRELDGMLSLVRAGSAGAR